MQARCGGAGHHDEPIRYRLRSPDSDCRRHVGTASLCYDFEVSHRIEVTTIRAKVAPIHSEPITVDFFLRPVGARGETLSERLNEPGISFVPVVVRGHAELLQLADIAYAETPDPQPEVAELEALGAWRRSVLIRLVSGEMVQGELIYVAPPERSRISDLLNADGARFLLMVEGARTRYVQRAAIARVRPPEDEPDPP